MSDVVSLHREEAEPTFDKTILVRVPLKLLGSKGRLACLSREEGVPKNVEEGRSRIGIGRVEDDDSRTVCGG